MIEIFNIIIQFLLFIFIYSINILPISKNHINIGRNEIITFNFLIHSNLILFLSVLNLSFLKITYIYLIILFLVLIVNFKANISFFRKIKKKNLFFFLLIFIVSFIIMLEIAANPILSWDSEGHWIYKTIHFYNNNSIETLNKLFHPHYPFLGPLLSATYWKISFIPYEYSGRLIFSFIFCLSIFNLVNNLNSSKIIKMIFFFLIIILIYDFNIIFTGNQEVLIFSLICFALKNLSQIQKKNKYFYEKIQILLICNLLIWTKQEGYFYSLFLILCLFFVSANKKLNITYLFVVLIFMALRISVFKYYDIEIYLNKTVFELSSFDYYNLTHYVNFSKFYQLVKNFIFSIFLDHFFLLGIFLFFLSLKLNIKFLYLNFYIYINFLFIFFVFLISENQAFILKTSLNRLIFNISPFIIILITEIFNTCKKLK